MRLTSRCACAILAGFACASSLRGAPDAPSAAGAPDTVRPAMTDYEKGLAGGSAGAAGSGSEYKRDSQFKKWSE